MQHGSQLDPPNPYVKTKTIPDLEHFEWDTEHLTAHLDRKIDYRLDNSQTIVSENDSPDIPFRYSVNPYRGCVHACPYCYARNTHEFLGLNAGLDFETQIFVKRNAPELFETFLSRSTWQPEPIIFCGVTDCYQPAEREFRLTQQCLEVAWRFRQPVSLITKNALIVRDLAVLQNLAGLGLVNANISLTTLSPELARMMEPRTSIPAARLRAIELLSQAGIPTRVMVAPVIPGLNDHEIPSILAAARNAGAIDARYVLLRLPKTVEPVFREWLERTQLLRFEKVETRIRQTRDGAWNQSEWGQRMTGQGPLAEQIGRLFRLYRDKLGFAELPALNTQLFRQPILPGQQRRLFE